MRVRSAAAAIGIVVIAALALRCSGPAAPVEAPAAGMTLVEQTFFDGHLKMLVPEQFAPLDEPALHARFHFDLASVVALHSVAHTVEVVAILQKSTGGADATEFKAPKAALLRLIGGGIKSAYAAKRCLRDEIVTRDDRPIYFFELASASGAADRRILCAYTFLGDRPLEVFFSCPEARASEWAPLGEKIVDSVVVKE